MISALVLAPSFSGTIAPGAGAVVRTLGALVPAAVEGLVRDVTLLAPSGDEELRAVADHAGCGLVEAKALRSGFAQALTTAKQPLVFVLRAGTAFDRGFLNEIAVLLGPDAGNEGNPCFLLRQAPEGFAARLLPDIAPVAGLIAPRERLSGPVTDFADIVRRVGRAKTLASRAAMTS